MNNTDVKLSWNQLKVLFSAYNDFNIDDCIEKPRKPLHAVVVFKSSNWPEHDYPLESRSYHCTSDNNCFRQYCFSDSCYCEAMDGSDPRVNIARYDWEIEYCYIL